MKNNILFIGATHGDEPIGTNVLKQLEKKRSDFDWIIGNPKALSAGTRTYEGDLNRSAPGNALANNYASRRAAEVIEKSNQYTYTIDLHGTKQKTGNFIIITKLTKENLRLASLIDIQRIVYWPAFSPELNGPLSEYFSCGLEIESGPKNDPKIQQELEKSLEDFLKNRETREQLDAREILSQREIFEVYGALTDQPNSILTEFVEARQESERFFPLLINCYVNLTGVFCYKMKRIDNIFTHKQLR